jgi:hypothetical protein
MLDNMQLLESLDLFKFQAIIKISQDVNVGDVLNELRAVPYVIIVRSKEDPRLEFKGTLKHIYILVSVKFLNTKPNPHQQIEAIKGAIMNGRSEMGKVNGVLQFIPIMKTLKPVRQ